MKTQIRQLKVDQTSVDPEGLYGSYPRIRLQGKWLSNLGFSTGDSVNVLCNTNQIIISRNGHQPDWAKLAILAHAARAIEVALAGKHSIKFIGHPEYVFDYATYCQGAGLEAHAFQPCPCGHYSDYLEECTCKVKEIQAHQGQINRIQADMTIDIPRPDPNCIQDFMLHKLHIETEDKMLERVTSANSLDTDIPLELPKECEGLMGAAIKQLHLSLKECDCVLRVARTIAKLEGQEKIKTHHLAEALQYGRQHINN